jgi:ABC-2 type transport system ATP-binding protein
MQELLHAHDLVKSFRGARAVDGVDFALHEGERLGLLGPNGAGKTTTLFMLLGIIEPDAGWVEIAGHRMPKGRSQAMMNLGFSAGYMPLPDRLRVSELLRMYGELYGMADPGPRIEAGLERFRIGHLAKAMGNELSSGQRTLVGIVKATLHRPKVLVLDEPTASLDPDVALQVRQGLEELCEEGRMALLITSHNMREIESLCERVIFLSAGRVVADDAPRAVAEQFGRGDLEGVFLQLAADRLMIPRSQETDRPAS